MATALLVAIIALGGWEVYWRIAGFSPSIEDDFGIWAMKRRTVDDKDGPEVILIGASRMQLDVDPQIFHAETGLDTVMLAIDGSSPLTVLADLAEQSSFHGIVLCSLLPQWLGDSGEGGGRSAKWVRKFHKKRWSFWVETGLSLFVQANFVFRYPGLLPDKLWQKKMGGDPLRPPYAPMRIDRYRPADYSKTDIGQLHAARVRRQQEIIDDARPMTDKEFAARVGEINALVNRLQERGARVIFLRLPSCDEILALEEKAWPRQQYWDYFAASTSAPTVHFADYPALSGYDCPDGSHLDHRDAQQFTKALVDVLGSGGLFVQAGEAGRYEHPDQ